MNHPYWKWGIECNHVIGRVKHEFIRHGHYSIVSRTLLLVVLGSFQNNWGGCCMRRLRHLRLEPACYSKDTNNPQRWLLTTQYESDIARGTWTYHYILGAGSMGTASCIFLEILETGWHCRVGPQIHPHPTSFVWSWSEFWKHLRWWSYGMWTPWHHERCHRNERVGITRVVLDLGTTVLIAILYI